jgi:hypothetical protein
MEIERLFAEVCNCSAFALSKNGQFFKKFAKKQFWGEERPPLDQKGRQLTIGRSEREYQRGHSSLRRLV